MAQELGGWDALAIEDLLRLHRYAPMWPSGSKADLPKPLYDALTNGSSLSIRYVNAEGQSSSRVIRPETSFSSGRYTYVRAFCEMSSEVRTFRLDRVILLDGEDQQNAEDKVNRGSRFLREKTG